MQVKMTGKRSRLFVAIDIKSLIDSVICVPSLTFYLSSAWPTITNLLAKTGGLDCLKFKNVEIGSHETQCITDF